MFHIVERCLDKSTASGIASLSTCRARIEELAATAPAVLRPRNDEEAPAAAGEESRKAQV